MEIPPKCLRNPTRICREDCLFRRIGAAQKFTQQAGITPVAEFEVLDGLKSANFQEVSQSLETLTNWREIARLSLGRQGIGDPQRVIEEHCAQPH